MMVPIDGPMSAFCDNGSVVANTTKPESALKKKHNAIACHRVREAVAAEIIRVAWVKGDCNLADCLAKCLPSVRLKELIRCVLWQAL